MIQIFQIIPKTKQFELKHNHKNRCLDNITYTQFYKTIIFNKINYIMTAIYFTITHMVFKKSMKKMISMKVADFNNKV